MSKAKKATQSVLLIITFTVLGKVTGFLREALIAARFGSGIQTDTYFIAKLANDLFIALLISSLVTTTIPMLSRIEALDGKKGKINHTNNLLSITGFIALGISAIAWLSAPLIMKIFAYGFDQDQFTFAVYMMRLGLPAIIFAAFSGIFNGYLQSENRFLVSSIAGITQNFFFITFLVFFAMTFGIKGLMITSIIGMAAQLTALIVGSRAIGYRYRFIMNIKDPYIQKILVLIPPILLSVAIGDINSMIDKAMASTLVSGSISALNYAEKLNSLVYGVFTSAILTVLYPMLSTGAAHGDVEEIKATTVQGINIIMLITIPATIGLLILTKPIVHIAYERGIFDAAATQMTVGALRFYTLCIVSSSMNGLLVRVFYSLHDTKTPVITSITAVAVNIIMNIVLIKPLAHMGLALATSLSSISTTVLLFILLRRKIGAIGLQKSLTSASKSLASSLIMALAVVSIFQKTSGYFNTSFFGKLVALLVPISIGVGIYVLLLYLLKVKELTWLVHALKKRVKRNI